MNRVRIRNMQDLDENGKWIRQSSVIKVSYDTLKDAIVKG